MRYTVAAQSSRKVRSSLQRRPSGLNAPLLTVRDLAVTRGRICYPTTQTLNAVCVCVAFRRDLATYATRVVLHRRFDYRLAKAKGPNAHMYALYMH